MLRSLYVSIKHVISPSLIGTSMDAELCRSGDQLSATRCALETGREEKQMVQLSLAEKETELLQAQDRLL